MNNYNKTTLKNGVRLVTAPLEGVETTTIMVVFGTGSRYETAEINGMAHFLEHMFFKGTSKRPTSLDITKELDGVGAEFNAFTGKDHTGYYVKVASKHFPRAIDVISDMLLNSKFDENELEKEKGVIVEEINMYKDNPIMLIGDIFEEEMYKGNSLSWLISGSHETVKATTRDAMVKYKESHYRGDNTVIAVAGKLSSGVEKQIEDAFSSLKGGDGLSKEFEFPEFSINQKEPRVRILHRESEQAQIGFGFPSYSYFNEDEVAMNVLSTILGGNMSSRLFISVREERGLAYMIRSGAHKYQDTGNFMIHAGLDKTRISSAIEVIREELDKVITEPVGEVELQRAKDYLQGKTSIALEDSSRVAQWYSEQELLTNKILTPQEKIQKVQSITPEDLQRVAKDVFKMEQSTLAVIGPYKENGEFLKLLS